MNTDFRPIEMTRQELENNVECVPNQFDER